MVDGSHSMARFGHVLILDSLIDQYHVTWSPLPQLDPHPSPQPSPLPMAAINLRAVAQSWHPYVHFRYARRVPSSYGLAHELSLQPAEPSSHPRSVSNASSKQSVCGHSKSP